MDLKQLFKRKSARIGFSIFCILFSAWTIHGFIDLIHQTHTRGVQEKFSAAVDELQKSPPGIERAEVFLKRLKAIDPGYAPREVKSALHDYISAMEQGMEALKSGRDTAQYDAAVADARQRLITAIKKYS
jgi:hypothetical protein